LADELIVYDPLPNGQLCWAIAWVAETMPGWWVQHGDGAEARRFFPRKELFPFAPSDVVDWMRKAHAYHACVPRRIVNVG